MKRPVEKHEQGKTIVAQASGYIENRGEATASAAIEKQEGIEASAAIEKQEGIEASAAIEKQEGIEAFAAIENQEGIEASTGIKEAAVAKISEGTERPAGTKVSIKICGLRTLEDVAAVNAVLPEYVGFIFVPGRRRYIEPARAELLRQQLDPRIRPVGVFVDASTEDIMETLKQCHLDMVQLHGKESDEDIEKLRTLYRKQIASAPPEGSRNTPTYTEAEAAAEVQCRERAAADGILRDHCTQDTRERMRGHPRRPLCIVKAFRVESAEDIGHAEASTADEILLDHGAGGTGERFDWTLLQQAKRRFFLAGGLDAANVSAAIRMAHPYAVDVSSSLETGGQKDPEKICRFVSAVRGDSSEARRCHEAGAEAGPGPHEHIIGLVQKLFISDTRSETQLE